MQAETKSVEQIDEELRALGPWKVTAAVALPLSFVGLMVLSLTAEGWHSVPKELVIGGWIAVGVLFLLGMGALQYSSNKARRLNMQKSFAGARALRIYRPIVAPPFMAFQQQMQQLAQASRPSSSQLSDKLRQLEHAHAQGLLSDEEFAKQRAALLLPDDLGVAALKCSSCGAQLNLRAGQTLVVCGYCSTTNHLVRS